MVLSGGLFRLAYRSRFLRTQKSNGELRPLLGLPAIGLVMPRDSRFLHLKIFSVSSCSRTLERLLVFYHPLIACAHPFSCEKGDCYE